MLFTCNHMDLKGVRQRGIAIRKRRKINGDGGNFNYADSASARNPMGNSRLELFDAK